MFTIESYALAVAACVVAMVCWGSWQNTTNLASRVLGRPWRFELYYWDFISGILLVAILYALTFGSMGSVGRGFASDLSQASASSIASAMIGGVIWNLGTLLLVAAIAMTGMSVAFPIGGGIGWLLGILVNYIAAPVGNPVYLFSGMAVVAVAIYLSMRSYGVGAGFLDSRHHRCRHARSALSPAALRLGRSALRVGANGRRRLQCESAGRAPR